MPLKAHGMRQSGVHVLPSLHNSSSGFGTHVVDDAGQFDSDNLQAEKREPTCHSNYSLYTCNHICECLSSKIEV